MMFVDCPVKTKVSWEWQPFGVGLSGSIKGQHTHMDELLSANLPFSAAQVNETVQTCTCTYTPACPSSCCRKGGGADVLYLGEAKTFLCLLLALGVC